MMVDEDGAMLGMATEGEGRGVQRLLSLPEESSTMVGDGVGLTCCAGLGTTVGLEVDVAHVVMAGMAGTAAMAGMVGMADDAKADEGDAKANGAPGKGGKRAVP